MPVFGAHQPRDDENVRWAAHMPVEFTGAESGESEEEEDGEEGEEGEEGKGDTSSAHCRGANGLFVGVSPPGLPVCPGVSTAGCGRSL